MNGSKKTELIQPSRFYAIPKLMSYSFTYAVFEANVEKNHSKQHKDVLSI